MMSEKNKILKKIYWLTQKGYELYCYDDNDSVINYNLKEKEFYDANKDFLIEEWLKAKRFDNSFRLFDEIKRCNNLCDKRIYNIITNNYLDQITTFSNDKEYVNLLEEVKKNIKQNNIIEDELRKYFYFFLNNHINASCDKDYINVLSIFLKKEKFINDDALDDEEIISNINCEDIEFIKYKKRYHEILVLNIFKEILSYTDDDLEDDIIYDKTILYQTLLRSVLVISNDERLNYYEELFYSFNLENKLATNIIRMAFASSQNDSLQIMTLRK